MGSRPPLLENLLTFSFCGFKNLFQFEINIYITSLLQQKRGWGLGTIFHESIQKFGHFSKVLQSLLKHFITVTTIQFMTRC